MSPSTFASSAFSLPDARSCFICVFRRLMISNAVDRRQGAPVTIPKGDGISLETAIPKNATLDTRIPFLC